MQFYLAANARCCVPVPAPCRAGACPRRAVLGGPQIPCLPPHPRPVPAGTAHPGSRSETPPAFAGGAFPGRRTRRPYMQRVLVRQTPKPRLPGHPPARSRRAPYKPALRSAVGAACRPPVQFYLAVNARCCVPVPPPRGLALPANSLPAAARLCLPALFMGLQKGAFFRHCGKIVKLHTSNRKNCATF